MDSADCTTVVVLSSGKTEWIKRQLKLPYMALDSGAVYLNGALYLFGGAENSAVPKAGPAKALYKLDNEMKWKRLANMNVGRRKITNSCLEWNGCIWVFGGRDRDKTSLQSVERYDPKKNQWVQMP